jgi:hypothetical protein
MSRLAGVSVVLAACLTAAAILAGGAGGTTPTGPALTFSPSSLNFGVRTIGTTFSITVTATNAEPVPTKILSIGYPNSQTFTMNDYCSGNTLAVSGSAASCRFDVVVAPTMVGPGTAYVQIAYSAGSLGGGTQPLFVTWIGVPPTQGQPTTLTTKLVAGSVAGTALSTQFGSPVVDTATLAGANAGTAGGHVTYTVYSDAACTLPVPGAVDAVSVTNGRVPSSRGIDLIPGIYWWEASYSGDSADLPSVSSCQSEELTVGFHSSVSCWGPSSPAVNKLRAYALNGLIQLAPPTLFAGGHFIIIVSCRVSRKLAMQLARDRWLLEFAQRSSGAVYDYQASVRLVSGGNPYAWEFGVSGGKPSCKIQAWVAGAPPWAGLPKIPPGFVLLRGAAFIAYYAKCVPLWHGLPIGFAGRPAVNHPTCSGSAPATFLTFPNHASSPGRTSLLLWCGLRSPNTNGFTGAWAPRQVLLYDYASFQNLRIVNGTLQNLSGFPVRPPIAAGFSVIGPEDVDITVPAGLPSAVYIPVVVTTGGVDVPSSNVLNVP